MRSPSFLVHSATLVVALGVAAPAFSQTFAATTGADPVISTPGPRPVKIGVPGHHRRGEEKLLYGRVRDGVYTVDGMVAKLQLNYDVNGVNFLYLFVPGVGTAVVSVVADPDAIVTEATYKDSELSFKVGDHHFSLTGVALASDQGTAPAHLFVKLDRSAWHLTRGPMIGFGNIAEMPYVWPGALPSQNAAQTEETQVVPPVPASLLPSVTAVIPVAAPVGADPATLHPVALR